MGLGEAGANLRPLFFEVRNGTPAGAGVSRGSPNGLGLVLCSFPEEKFDAVISYKLEGVTYIRGDVCFGN